MWLKEIELEADLPARGQDDDMSKEIAPPASGFPYRDLLKSAVGKIPSTFGRLTYLAAFREPESGRYKHGEAAGIFEPHEVHEVLRREHLETFKAWLCLSMEEQAADLAAYLWKHFENRGEPSQKWMKELPYAELIPEGALSAQQELFRSDLELVLRVFYDQTT